MTIDLARKGERPLVVGHRGAAALAPENTLEAFVLACTLGVDLVELDVLALDGGELVVAHSDRLEEITHGAAAGRVGGRSLAELRELAPGLPTLDEALEWFARNASAVGLQIDLKTRTRLDAVAAALELHGLTARAVVSSPYPDDLQAVARAVPGIRLGLTYPNDRLEVSRRRVLRPLVRAGLSLLRAALPRRLERLTGGVQLDALMLQHRLVSPATVARAHAAGLAVFAWTVDEPEEIVRVAAAGVDAVTANDPRGLLATLAS